MGSFLLGFATGFVTGVLYSGKTTDSDPNVILTPIYETVSGGFRAAKDGFGDVVDMVKDHMASATETKTDDEVEVVEDATVVE